MDRTKLLNIVKFSIGIFLGIWTIVMLSFSLVYAALPEYLGSMSKYFNLDRFNNNGFTFMGFASLLLSDGNWSWASKLLGMFSIVFLLIGITGICVSVLSLCNIIKKSKFATTFIIIELACMFLYMVFGIIITAVANGHSDYYFGFESGFKTVAFVPLIVGSVFTIAYFIVPKIVMNLTSKIESENTKLNKVTIKESKKSVTADVGEKLRNYKQLVADGLINENDYEELKEQLLKL